MATNFTNQKAAQALRSQAALVTLNGTDSANLYKVKEGQLATNNSSGKVGKVASVDVYGHSFEVSPLWPYGDFASLTPYGYLAVNETVIVQTP